MSALLAEWISIPSVYLQGKHVDETMPRWLNTVKNRIKRYRRFPADCVKERSPVKLGERGGRESSNKCCGSNRGLQTFNVFSYYSRERVQSVGVTNVLIPLLYISKGYTTACVAFRPQWLPGSTIVWCRSKFVCIWFINVENNITCSIWCLSI